MSITETPRQQSAASRQVGYFIGAAVNAALLYIINVNPGWRDLPILTEDTTRVLWLVTLSLLVGVGCNLIYAVYDAKWLTSLGAVVTTAIGLVVLVRIWQVFPFDFSDSPDWALVARYVLVFAIGGSVIGLVVQFVTLVRALARLARTAG